MAAFDFDDGIIIISLVPDFDKFAFHDLMKVRPDATGVRVMVPMSTWLDSNKVAQIAMVASENKLPVSFQSVDKPLTSG